MKTYKGRIPKIFLVIVLLIFTTILSWLYFNERLNINNILPSTQLYEKYSKSTTLGRESDTVIFLWDIPSIHSDWTGLLSRPFLHDYEKEGSTLDDIDGTDSLEYNIPTEKISVKRNCSVSCYFTHNFENFQMSHGILFDPFYLDKENWRRTPLKLPEKHPHQKFSLLHHNSLSQYPLLSHPTYSQRMDFNITYSTNSIINTNNVGGIHYESTSTTGANKFNDKTLSVPEITLACSPFSSAGSINRVIKLLHKPLKYYNKSKDIVFMSSNCFDGYSTIRTNMVSELMNTNLKIDSYGKCINNVKRTISPKDPYQSINQKIRYNIEIFKDYKFAITFENENSTNYVTEKIYSALYAGAIPIYMGANNIDDYVPTGSFINVNKFQSVDQLSKEIKRIMNDENEYAKYFEWKSKPLEAKVIDKLQRCINSYESKCSICELFYSSTSPEQHQYRKSTFEEISTYYQSFYLEMSGKGDHIVVQESDKCKGAFNLTREFTFMAWVKPSSFSDQRIIDKNVGGKIFGYNFDIQTTVDPRYGYARLCSAKGCYESRKRLSTDVWHHLAVTSKNNDIDIHKNKVVFYIDGIYDFQYDNLDDTATNDLPLTIGKIANSGEISSGSYHGNIDNVMIFNVSLSGDKVKSYVWEKPYGDESNLILYYDFDYNSLKVALDRTIIEDKSACKNDGRLLKGANSDYSQRILSYSKDVTFNKCL